MEKNKISTFAGEECGDILKNAITSFLHGIEHLSKYAEGENNIKFSILHIFHTVELLMKAHLGLVNKNLLKEKIDVGVYNDESKIANITVLLNRMDMFSEVAFDENLGKQIEKLRVRRNAIEHKKFVLENETELLILICDVVHGMIEFLNYPSYGWGSSLFDVMRDNSDMLSNARKKFHETRIKIDKNYSQAIKEINRLESEGSQVAQCPVCLNQSLPYKKEKESKIKCLVCKENFYVLECVYCFKNLCPSDPKGQDGRGTCDECARPRSLSFDVNGFRHEEIREEKRRDNLPEEKYK